ncbi:helicase associated domain-containing protein [Streptomyces achromogenes]|uniref:helicase associated domain-containing protein n=1 Tax=Streptomyces achromogenes TaxID=67255 RepID=UPI0036FB22B6
MPRWLERWLRQQIAEYSRLAAELQQLLAQLGLTAAEIDRFHAWPARRRSVLHGLEAAHDYAARHGHLAVSHPTSHDGFALGKWLNQVRHRQRAATQPTRLGRRLTALDTWWNPPWPLDWQRYYWAARHHLHGLPEGVVWWTGAPDEDQARQWLHAQQASWHLLQPGQQELVSGAARGGVARCRFSAVPPRTNAIPEPVYRAHPRPQRSRSSTGFQANQSSASAPSSYGAFRSARSTSGRSS